jgi:hypothetical protein
LTGFCSDRLIATLIANPPYLLLEQEVIHSDLQTLYYDLGDIHKPTSQIEEDIEFQIGLIIKLNLGKISNMKTELYSSVWTLKTNISDLHRFCRFAHL